MGLCNIIYAQNVNIPDANFKAALISNLSINTNADSVIQVSEAAAYTGTINVTYLGISSIIGIEAFKALTNLNCYGNSITSLDVSANTALTYFSCGSNALTSLDVSANTALVGFSCDRNGLTSLNVSNNTALTSLACSFNHLTSLDISANTNLFNLECFHNQLTSLNVALNTNLHNLYCFNNLLTNLNVSTNVALLDIHCNDNLLTSLIVASNTNLKYLDCSVNKMTSLDVSANTALISCVCSYNNLTSLNVKNGNNTNLTFDATNNLSLSCIQVDNANYSTTNWPTGKDAGANYSENCSVTGIATLNNEASIEIYPNPTNGNFQISFIAGEEDNASINIINEHGQHIYNGSIQPMKNRYTSTIDLSKESKGVYFIEIITGDKKSIQKIVLK